MEHQSFKKIAHQYFSNKKQHFPSSYSHSDLNKIIKNGVPKSPKQAQRSKLQNAENISLIGQYQKLLKSTHAHAQYSKKQIGEQLKKHNQYFENLNRILKKKQAQSEIFLQNLLQQIQHAFDERIQLINHKIVNLCCPSTPNPTFRQSRELKNLKSIKIEFIKLQIPDVKFIEQQIEKITFGSMHEVSLIELVNHSTKGEQQIIQNLCQLTCKQNLDYNPCCMKVIENTKLIDRDKIIFEAPEFSQEGSSFDH